MTLGRYWFCGLNGGFLIEFQDLRKKVAREAAALLYSGIEKEYKQAKLKAAETFGIHYLPTNLEVAVELDKIADENEGSARQTRLVKMRKQALWLMQILEEYDPVLVGSVWRGTIRRDSDLDIIVHHYDSGQVLQTIIKNGVTIEHSQWVSVTKQGKKLESFHIYLELPTKEKGEVIVHSPDEACLRQKCEIYGDNVAGLRTHELEKVLKQNPAERFVPV